MVKKLLKKYYKGGAISESLKKYNEINKGKVAHLVKEIETNYAKPINYPDNNVAKILQQKSHPINIKDRIILNYVIKHILYFKNDSFPSKRDIEDYIRSYIDSIIIDLNRYGQTEITFELNDFTKFNDYLNSLNSQDIKGIFKDFVDRNKTELKGKEPEYFQTLETLGLT